MNAGHPERTGVYAKVRERRAERGRATAGNNELGIVSLTMSELSSLRSCSRGANSVKFVQCDSLECRGEPDCRTDIMLCLLKLRIGRGCRVVD